MSDIIMHLDMNSYFASVEQQANPFLRHRSVAVCAYLSPGGCIIASSLEAKAKGIKTGCRISDALKLDPKLILIENEPDKYRSVTARIFRIMRDYSELVEPYSIDEAFIDLTGYVPDFASANNLAQLIKSRIKSEVGDWLECSVGIAWTRFLAKLAGDLAPKRGILIIDNENTLDQLIKQRPLTEAWGIGEGWNRRLNELGITTLDELKSYDGHRLRALFGRSGYYLWANLNGLELEAIRGEASLPKSIGHSYCLPKHSRDRDYLDKVLYKLAEKTGRRLRALSQEAGSISLCLAYKSGGAISGTFKTKEAIFTTAEIWREVASFLSSHRIMLPVSMVALSVSNLKAVSGQLDFFGLRSASRNLSQAMDSINDRYGDYTVISGSMWDTTSIARDRIGFRKSVTI